MARKRKRKLTAAQRRAKRQRAAEYMTIFVNGKQKRVRRPQLIDGLDAEEFLLRNADPIWLHQNELWEYIRDDSDEWDSPRWDEVDDREPDHDGLLPLSCYAATPIQEIDTIVAALREAYPRIAVHQLDVEFPGADDDGLWFIAHPDVAFHVQLESSLGTFPFLVETDRHAERVYVTTVEEAVAVVGSWLGLGEASPEGPNASSGVPEPEAPPRSPRLKPVVLEGELVRLVPLSLVHVPALHEAGRFDAIWRWNPNGPAVTREAMQAYVERALAQHEAGLGLPFTTMLRDTGEIVGSTRFTTVDPRQPRIEIGYTWITPRWQRTGVNTEAKYLMLRHAFDVWNLARVEFQTDARNATSRAAIGRLGAAEEGFLRRHLLCHDGHLRDTVVFALLAEEWSEVRARLEKRLARG